MATEVRLKVTSDSTEAISDFERLVTRASATGVVIGNVLTKGFELAGRAVGAMVDQVGAWIEASNESENAVNALNAALAATGQTVPGLSAEYQALAASMQAVTTVEADELLPLMGRLITVGGIHQSQMERATKAAIDLAQATGKGLPDAFMMVAKAAQGQTKSLRESGIVIQSTGNNVRDFETTLTALESKFGGSAAAAAATFDGRMIQVNNSIEDMQETLGHIVKVGISPFLDGLQKTIPKVEEFIAAHKPEAIQAVATALELVVRGTEGLVRAGAAAAETYANMRLLTAEGMQLGKGILDRALEFDEWGRKLLGLGPPVGGLVDTLKDLSAGIDANVADQEEYVAKTERATTAVTELASSVADSLIGALQNAGKETQDVTAATVDLTRAKSEAAAAMAETDKIVSERIRQREADHEARKKTWREEDKARNEQRLAEIEREIVTVEELTASLNERNIAMKLGGREMVEFKDGKELDSILQSLQATYDQQARGAGGQLGRNYIDSFLEAIRTGDLSAAKDTAGVARGQASSIQAGRAGKEELERVAFMLEQFAAKLGLLATPTRRAGGGPVMAGRPYLVGDRFGTRSPSAEVFVPNHPGNINPNPGAFFGGDSSKLEALLRTLVEQGKAPTQVVLDGKVIATTVANAFGRGATSRMIP